MLNKFVPGIGEMPLHALAGLFLPQGNASLTQGARVCRLWVNLRTASWLTQFLRALVSILSSAIILPVVIYLIELGSLIDYHTD